MGTKAQKETQGPKAPHTEKVLIQVLHYPVNLDR